MKIIGMCGRSGSGKSTVGEYFHERGIPTISADLVYHEIVSAPSECLSELTGAFGADILAPDGSLDRKRLSSLVFGEGSSPDAVKRLNSITHRHVLWEMERRITSLERQGMGAVLCDVPLLFESGFDRRCDHIIAVTLDDETRISRLVLRDGISRDMAERRLSAQATDDFLRARADFVIENLGDRAALAERIAEIFDEIIKR